MRSLTSLIVVSAAAATLVLSGTPAIAHPDLDPVDRAQRSPIASTNQLAAASSAQLARQVRANSLTPAQARALQARVSRVVARTGGTQVAINQVVWNGGDTLIPLPGERWARELDVTPKAGTVHGCSYYQFCTYGHRDFTGMVDRISSCTWHVSHGFFVAYVNNQTPGTRARFYDYYRHYLAVSQPAFSQDAQFGNVLGHQTHYIRPC